MERIKKILNFSDNLIIYLLVISLFNIALINFPLTNVFGFEFSVLNAALLVLLSGLFVISLLKKRTHTGNYAERKINKILLNFLLFFILPASISIVNSIFTISCSFCDGVQFYFVITFPSLIIGSALGLFSFIISKKLNKTIFVIIYILILLIPLAEFYYNPQVYFYNPIFGYYPGTIFDEGLSVSLKLLGYRIFNLVYFGSIALIGIKYIKTQKRSLKRLFLLFSIIIPFIFYYFSPQLGYTTTFNKLDKTLSRKAITPHFIIHYPPSINKKLADTIILLHEYFYQELKSYFKYDLNKKINSYLFLNDTQKKILFGSANADVAKPWQYSDYVTYNDYNSILKHELAHCYSAKFGTGLFKVADNINPSLIEGIAVAADPFYGENSIDYMAALAYKNGYKVNLKNLYRGFNFFGQTSSLSYIYAGSFTRFLINNYGIKRFKELYVSNDFLKSYGNSLDYLQDKFFHYLDSLKIEKGVHKANFYFGRKSIIYKVCPRYVADRLQKAWSKFNNENYSGARREFREILKTTDNYSAILGLASSEVKLGNIKQGTLLLKENLLRFKNSAYYYNMEFKLADLEAGESNYTSADSLYKNLVLQNPNRSLFNLANLRISLSRKDSLLKYYVNGNDFDKYDLIQTLNIQQVNYYSLPVAVNLSKYFNEDYKIFSKNFIKNFTVKNYSSSYAMLKLSNYMMEHSDYTKAEKFASLALSYDANWNFNIILKSNYKKINWLKNNSADLLKKITFSQH